MPCSGIHGRSGRGVATKTEETDAMTGCCFSFSALRWDRRLARSTEDGIAGAARCSCAFALSLARSCRRFLGPQKTRRREVQEAWSEESRKGPQAGFLLEKQFSKTAWEPPTLLIRERGIEARLHRAQISTGPRRSLILRKLWLVLLEGG